ncbi:MAG: hypothetical protein ACI9GJ_000757, partial [Parasphingorhabdus sp.]
NAPVTLTSPHRQQPTISPSLQLITTNPVVNIDSMALNGEQSLMG